MKILVLAGGLSPERDVSLSSGSLVANALIENGHEVGLTDLYVGLTEPGGPLFHDKASGKRFGYAVPETEPDLVALRARYGHGLIGPGVIDACKKADIVFIALHGSIGENGQLQTVLELEGIRYTGSGSVGSTLAMDKDLAKRIIRFAGIPTPDWELLGPGQNGLRAAEKLGFPCVVKPLGCGSSVGVSIARDGAGLLKAIAEAEKQGQAVMLEKMVEGREFSVGVMGGQALPVIEIIPKTAEFYDYAHKYQPGFTSEICPASLAPEVAARLQASAGDVHRALRLGYYSRVDFMLDKNGSHFCLEANTLPGMTPTSLLPQEAAAAGIGYNELCEKLILGAANG
jgi:D-alanine-D-alanine ligase